MSRAFERELDRAGQGAARCRVCAQSLDGDGVAQGRRHSLRSRVVDEPARRAVAAHSHRHPRRRERRRRAHCRNALCGGGRRSCSARSRTMVGELRTEVKAGRPVTSMLKDIHDAARGLRTEMDMSVDSPWSRQLAAIRSDVSDLLKAEIETAPGRVRRLLRPRAGQRNRARLGSSTASKSSDVESAGRIRHAPAAITPASLRVSEVDHARLFGTDAYIWRPAPRCCSMRCVMPAMPIGRSGSRRSRPRSASADRSFGAEYAEPAGQGRRRCRAGRDQPSASRPARDAVPRLRELPRGCLPIAATAVRNCRAASAIAALARA